MEFNQSYTSDTALNAGMSMKLASIKADAEKFGKAISAILDVDVLIVDHNCKVVSNTSRYFNRFSFIHPGSVIGKVIRTKEVVTVRERNNYKQCHECPDYESCEMVGFIGVPIWYENAVVGAITLILPQHRVTQIFDDEHNSIEFMQHMADLLSSKIRNHDELDAVNVVRYEREALIDAVGEGIVETDDIGYITYCNRKFMSFLGLEKDVTGIPIWKLIPHKLILDFWENRGDISNRPILLRMNHNVFYGLLSCRMVNVKNICSKVFFAFKPFSNINMEIREMDYQNRLISFQWEKFWLFGQDVEEQAKHLAVTDKIILLQGKSNMGVDILANCIHRFSIRGANLLLTVQCTPLYRELMDDLIFGDFGKLYLAHQSTIFFKDIEKLPMYLQKKLVRFMYTGSLKNKTEQIDIPLDVRMIFSTDENLEELVRQGRFDEKLYYLIAGNVIYMDKLHKNKGHLHQIIQTGIKFYCKQLGKKDIVFAPDVIEMLVQYHWSGGVEEVDYVLEQLVTHCENTIQLEDLKRLDLIHFEKVKSISEIEREKIAELLKSNFNKDDIAVLLGVSRATLYRKIKNYNL